jgi:hypothetical protein
VLQDLSQPWLVLKGPTLVELAYGGDVGLRDYGDLDLLTSRVGFGPMLEVIEQAGGRVLETNWPLLSRLRHGEITLRLPMGGLGDLHWHLIYYPSWRARFAVQMDELLDRSVTAVIGATRVRVLERTDQLLHLCLHGALSGGHLLIWLKDIEQMVASSPPDWDELLVRARRYRLGLICALMLQRARLVLGAGVPSEVIDALAPDRLLLGLWALQQRYAGDAPWGRFERTGQTLMAATSAGSFSSLDAFCGSLVKDVAWAGTRRRIVALRGGARRGGANREQVSVLFQPVGGDGERRRYVEVIATDAGP